MITAKSPPPLLPGEVRAYPVLPLRDIVVFPHIIVPLFVGREKSVRALEKVTQSDTSILLATQKNASDDDPATNAIFEVGTLASVLQLLKLPDGTVKVLVEGTQRARILKYTDRPEFYEAEAVVLEDTIGERVEAEALSRSAVSEFEGYVKLSKKVPPEVVRVVQQIDDLKLLAALRGGIKTVLIPEENAKDLFEIPESVKGALKIIPISRMDDVLDHSLVRKLEPIAWEQGSAKPAEGRSRKAPRH